MTIIQYWLLSHYRLLALRSKLAWADLGTWILFACGRRFRCLIGYKKDEMTKSTERSIAIASPNMTNVSLWRIKKSKIVLSFSLDTRLEINVISNSKSDTRALCTILNSLNVHEAITKNDLKGAIKREKNVADDSACHMPFAKNPIKSTTTRRIVYNE